MIDLLSINKIQYLHPKIRNEVLDAYCYINHELLNENVQLKISYTYRSKDQQDYFYKLGRSILFDKNGNNLGVITMDKGGQSLNNYGLAFNIYLLEDKYGDGFNHVLPYNLSCTKDAPIWKEVINHFEKIGWTWGYNLNGVINPTYFEKKFGYSVNDLQMKIASGETIRETINGVLMNWVEL